MNEPTRIGEGFRRAIEDFAHAWLKRDPRCDWCGTAFDGIEDLHDYVDFCMNLNKVWSPKKKRLPPARVFCDECASGAISELIDGIRFTPDRVPF